MKYLVNFSGGLCSYWSAERTIQRHGRENVINLFADVLIEDPSLYVFNQVASEKLGVPLVRVSREMTPWQLFRKEGLIANNQFPICSVRLKRELLNEWMEQHYNLDVTQADLLHEQATIVLGFDFTELHRVEEFRKEHPNWLLEAPMTEEPIWDKCRMEREARDIGLPMSLLYELGFPHNNCGGRCVRAGISQWVHLYRVLPERYLEWEEEELATQQVFKARGIENWDYTILRDRRGGETKPLTLRALRLRIEAGEKFPDKDWGGCGCGGVFTANAALLTRPAAV